MMLRTLRWGHGRAIRLAARLGSDPLVDAVFLHRVGVGRWQVSWLVKGVV